MKIFIGFWGVVLGAALISFYTSDNWKKVPRNPASTRSLASIIPESQSSLDNIFEQTFGDTQCAVEWKDYLKRKNITLDMSQARPPLKSGKIRSNGDNSVSYYIPTMIIGAWVELRKFKPNPKRGLQGRLEIRHLTSIPGEPTKLRKVIKRWRETQDCKLTTKNKVYDIYPNPRKSVIIYDDIDIRGLVKGFDKGLIYIWSPHMPYSAASQKVNKKLWGLDALNKVVKEKDLNFKFLLDPRANTQAARELFKEMGDAYPSLKNNSMIHTTTQGRKRGMAKAMGVEFFIRMTGLHYPSLLYFSRGKIAHTHLPGIASKKQIIEYVDQQEKILSQYTQGEK